MNEEKKEFFSFSLTSHLLILRLANGRHNEGREGGGRKRERERERERKNQGWDEVYVRGRKREYLQVHVYVVG